MLAVSQSLGMLRITKKVVTYYNSALRTLIKVASRKAACKIVQSCYTLIRSNIGSTQHYLDTFKFRST